MHALKGDTFLQGIIISLLCHFVVVVVVVVVVVFTVLVVFSGTVTMSQKLQRR